MGDPLRCSGCHGWFEDAHALETHGCPAAADGPSKSRKGLDRLLTQYPGYDLIRVENQEYGELPVTDLFGGRPGGFKGPWTIIDLHARDGRSQPILRCAIWNVTGNVYHCDDDGAVADDPFITITPLTAPPEARRRGERE